MSATTATQAAAAPTPAEVYLHALELTLNLAVSQHQAGFLAEAEQLYRGILQTEPEQPQASHNLGLLLAQMQRLDEGLPYLESALAAKPESARYWLSYIEALILDGQVDLARERLAFAREHGLEGEGADALQARLAAAELKSGAEGKAVEIAQ